MRNNQYSIWPVLFLLTSACTSSKVESKQELINYLHNAENGTIQVHDITGITTSLMYRPHDLLVLQELQNNTFDETQIKEVRSRYAPYSYFTLRVSQNDQDVLQQSSDQQQFSALLQTLAFRMDQYVYAIVNGEEIPLADFQFSRLYGTSGGTKVLLAFKYLPQHNNAIKVVVDEFGLGIGKQEFEINGADLLNTPALDFEKILR